VDSSNRLPDRRSDIATHPSPDQEESRLDDALKRADDLLVSSLKRDEHQRRRRKIHLCVAVGGIAMLAVPGVISFLLFRPDKKPEVAPLLDGPAEIQLSADNETADQLSEEGWQLWRKHELDQAIAKFEEATKLNPELTEAWDGLGWSEFNSGDSVAAEKAFNKVIQIMPKYPPALNGLGQIYFGRSQFDRAEKYLLPAALVTTAAPWTLTKIYLLQSKWTDAKKYAQIIVGSSNTTGPDLDDAKAMLAAAKNQSLPDDLKKKISPTGGVSSDVQQGWQALNQGDVDKAIGFFDRAIRRDENDADAWNGVGWVDLRRGIPQIAQKEFERAIQLNPDAAGAMNGLAMTYRQQNRLDDAIKTWEQMLQKSPGVNAGTYGLADAYVAKAEYDKAIPLYEQILKANPNDQATKTKLDDARQHTIP
jgi:tetratricopeptide (TPR) repeat protein